MTREEDLDWLCRLRSEIYVYMPKDWLTSMDNALQKAIKALKQEPCEDAISRQAVLKTLDDMDNVLDDDKTIENYKELLKECYEGLTPVNPQMPILDKIRCEIMCKDGLEEALEIIDKYTSAQEPKIGHWMPCYGNVKCSVCGNVKDSRNVGKATHYCDFCGARMVKPKEGEE